MAAEPLYAYLHYVKEITQSSSERQISAAIDSLDENTKDSEIIKKLLLTGLATKYPSSDAGKNAISLISLMATANAHPLAAPVVIVAGGCSSDVEVQMRTYKNFILSAFSTFQGTIISGGTVSGISGLIGAVQEQYLQTIRTIGYVPRTKTSFIDSRYSEIRLTENDNFSPLEPVQYWIDIIASGICLAKVKLLGINGGSISAFEYRLALALGVKVGIVKDSGLDADLLLNDAAWNTLPNLCVLSSNPQEGQAFLAST